MGTKDGFSSKYCADKFEEDQRELIENFNKAYKKAARTEKAVSKWFDKMCQSETEAVAIDNAFALYTSLGNVASFDIENLDGYLAKPAKRTKLSDEEKAANKLAKLNRKAAARAFVKSVDADTRKKWHMDLGFSEDDAEALKNDIQFWIINTIGVWDITSDTHIPEEWAHIKHVPRKSKKTTQENDSTSD